MAFDFPASPAIDQEFSDTASNTHYKYDGVTWLRMPPVAGAFTDAPNDGVTYGRRNREWQDITQSGALSIGDVKTGFQQSDHAGWVKLDGRATADLASTQKQRATSLGFAVNLPNGANAVLMQNGLAMGAVSTSALGGSGATLRVMSCNMFLYLGT